MKKKEVYPEIPPEQRVEEIKKIVEGEYPEEANASVGENRGQLFVRIPKNIRKHLNIQKGDKIIFRVSKQNKNKVEIEVKN